MLARKYWAQLTEDQQISVAETLKNYLKEHFSEEAIDSQNYAALLNEVNDLEITDQSTEEIIQCNDLINIALSESFRLYALDADEIKQLTYKLWYFTIKKDNLIYFIALNEPEKIREWGEQRRAQGLSQFTLDIEQLFFPLPDELNYNLTQAHWDALKEALKDTCSLTINVQLRKHRRITARQWKMLGQLTQDKTFLGIGPNIPIHFTSKSLLWFQSILDDIRDLDIKNITFSQNQETMALFYNLILARHSIRLATKFFLKPIVNHIPFNILRLTTPVNRAPLYFIRDLDLMVKSLDLSNNHLNHFPLVEWQKLCDRLFNITHLHLEENQLSLLSNLQLKNIIAILCQKIEILNLSYNGFATCRNDKWHALCNAIKRESRRSPHNLIITISDLPENRQQQLNIALQKTSLKTATRLFFFNQASSVTSAKNLLSSKDSILPQDLMDQLVRDDEYKEYIAFKRKTY